jgi:hypothetical protein
MEKKMPDFNVVTLGNTMHRVSAFRTPPQMPTVTEFKQFSKDIYARLTDSPNFDLSAAARCEEFLAIGLVGAPGGEELAPAIWSSHGQAEMYGLLSKAKNVFIHTVPYAVYFAANNYESVYVLNCASTKIAIEHAPDDVGGLDNVTTLSWDDAYNNMPPLDMAVVLFPQLASDDKLCDALLDAITPGGVLVVHNSSNGGALYEVLADKKSLDLAANESLSAALHKKLLDRGDFVTQHFQGWISHTTCVKLPQ